MIHRYMYLSLNRHSNNESYRQSEFEMPRSSMRSTQSIPSEFESHTTSITISPIVSSLSVQPASLDPTSTSSVSQAAPTVNAGIISSSFDLQSALSVSWVCFSLLTGLFWSFLGFDMIGDVYGSGTGILASVLVSVVLFVADVGCLMLRGINETDAESNPVDPNANQDQPDPAKSIQ